MCTVILQSILSKLMQPVELASVSILPCSICVAVHRMKRQHACQSGSSEVASFKFCCVAYSTNIQFAAAIFSLAGNVSCLAGALLWACAVLSCKLLGLCIADSALTARVGAIHLWLRTYGHSLGGLPEGDCPL